MYLNFSVIQIENFQERDILNIKVDLIQTENIGVNISDNIEKIITSLRIKVVFY